jgi:hypothetical protein
MAKEGTPEGISRAEELGMAERMSAAVEAERVLRGYIVEIMLSMPMLKKGRC